MLLELDGLPLFLHCVRRFLPAAAPGCLVVVHPRGGGDEFRLAAERFLPDAPIVWTAGGAFRCASVQAGLAAIPLREGIVAIHDAARPLASVSLLETLAEEARRSGGAIPGKPVTDTLKRSDGGGMIAGTVSREGLWRVETPQVFDLSRLRAAYAANPENGINACGVCTHELQLTAQQLQRDYMSAGSGWKDEQYKNLGQIVEDSCAAILQPIPQLESCQKWLQELAALVEKYET